MKRTLLKLLILYMLSSSVFFFQSCGKSPEDARKELWSMGIQYTPENFFDAAKKGDMLALKLFLQAGMSPNITRGWQGHETPLYSAVEYQHYEAAKFLLDNGALPTADCLNMAVHLRLSNICELLLQRGADVNPAIANAVSEGNLDFLSLVSSKAKDKLTANNLLLVSLATNDESGLKEAISKHAQVSDWELNRIYAEWWKSRELIDKYFRDRNINRNVEPYD